jgi:hypothetical protein
MGANLGGEHISHTILPVRINIRRPAWHLTFAVIVVMGSAASLPADEPLLALSSNQLSFAPQIQGTNSAPQAIVLTNNGDGELTITGVTIGGQNNAEFRQTTTCPISPATLASHASCEIQVIFRPRTIGALTASLAIADNASGSPHSVGLAGTSTATAPTITLNPASLSFENQPSGTSSGVAVATLANAGSANLSISSPIRINGPNADEFRLQKIVNGCPYDAGQVPPKTSCGIGVIFAPATSGAKSAQVIIEDDAAGSPHAIALSGTGVAPHEPSGAAGHSLPPPLSPERIPSIPLTP